MQYEMRKQDKHTMNVTVNNVSQALSRFTFVNCNGVFSGFPPFGISNIISRCCAYRLRNACVRSPFCSGVTLGRNLKHAIRVTRVLFCVSVILNHMKMMEKIIDGEVNTASKVE